MYWQCAIYVGAGYRVGIKGESSGRGSLLRGARRAKVSGLTDESLHGGVAHPLVPVEERVIQMSE